MTQDPRFLIRPPLESKYYLEIEQKALFLEGNCRTEDLEMVSNWLAYEILSLINPSIFSCIDRPKLKDLPIGLLMAANSLYQSIVEQQHREPNEYEIEYLVLDKKIGMKIASLSNEILNLDDLSKFLIKYHGIYAAWLEHIENLSNSIEQQIFHSPSYENILELVRIYGRLSYKSQWGSFDAQLKDEQLGIFKNKWKIINEFYAYYSFTLKVELDWRNRLLLDNSFSSWIQWVMSLPIMPIQVTAVKDIRNLDTVERLIVEILNVGHYQTDDRVNLLLLLMIHAIELWNEMSNKLIGLTQVDGLVIDEVESFRKQMEKEKNNWFNIELPQRSNKLANILVSGQSLLGMNAIYAIIPHLIVKKKGESVNHFREAISKQIALQQNSPELIKKILSFKNGNTPILISTLIIFNSKEVQVDTIDEIWKAYYDLLTVDNWRGGFYSHQDDYNFVRYMASLLLYTSDPTLKIQQVIESTKKPHEGWQYNSKEHHKSRDQMAHLIIVGAIASELMHNKQFNASDTYSYIWKTSHDFLRSSANIHDEMYKILIKELWKRLVLIHPNDYKDKAISAIINMDYLNHIIIAVSSLQEGISQYKNKEQELDQELQEVIFKRYNELMPVYREQTNVTKEEIQRYENVIKKLTSGICQS
ncbi:hypothetical protein ACFSTH_11880 [Paenibacillus yanchengensis]|uniref:Uncharacterized protein n=1 Tax=Paenibacillus yanchengensis TaxID=2035833 RepID=A0ABW4YJM3_9BACL